MHDQFKNIGVISTRLAGTDGVSLETGKWVHVLEEAGHRCFFLAGELDTPADASMLVEPAHFANPEVLDLHEALFGRTEREPALTRRIHQLKDKLKKSLYRFIKAYELNLLLCENILAIPMHIPLAMAVTEILAETAMPCVAHHHDFFWERERFSITCAADLLAYAFPPLLPNIRHAVINTSACEQLALRRGVSGRVVPNVFDFENPPLADETRRKALRRELGFKPEELFILQPTRVVPRKRIELAVEIARRLVPDRPKLVISHKSGDEGHEYEQRVRQSAEALKVELIFIADKVGAGGVLGGGDQLPFDFSDAYNAADLITYPSDCEGFGNAFIESVYYQKPVVVRRYPVFVRDIEPKGFDVACFDGFVSDGLILEIKELLKPQRREKAVKHNYQMGLKHFSYQALRKKLPPMFEK